MMQMKTPTEKRVVTGDYAAAHGALLARPKLVAAYPITPQTIIVEAFSEFVADGLVNTEYVCAESEHSAMSMCIGASASGARTATATASAGLAFMWEMLYIASGMRLPIVMAVANRALSGPINIHCDHSDAMGARDSGWVQIFGEERLTAALLDRVTQNAHILELIGESYRFRQRLQRETREQVYTKG